MLCNTTAAQENENPVTISITPQLSQVSALATFSCTVISGHQSVTKMDVFLNNTDKEWERMVNRERALVKSGPPKGSVRMKALMLELNFPIQIESRDRGSGYNYGKKWTYLNGKH